MTLLLSFLILGLGQAGPIFLAITPGAKAVSMGSAFTALSDDATCIYYNPAALAFIDRAKVSSMNLSFPAGLGRGVLKGLLKIGNLAQDIPEKIEQPWLFGLYKGMRYMYWGGAIPITKKDAIGIGYTYLSTEKTEATDPDGNPIDTFTSYDYAISISYGRELWNGLSLGASLKYIYSYLCPSWVIERIFGHKDKGCSKTIALDIGFMYQTPIPGVSIGASYQNLGKGVSYLEDGERDPLPKIERRGIAIQPMAILDSLDIQFGGINPADYIRYTFTCDLVNELIGGTGTSHDMFYCRGNELTFLNVFSYRWGYFEDRVGLRIGETKGYALNLGVLQFEVATDSEIYDFPTDNWRVQVNLTSCDTSEFQRLRKDSRLNAGATILSSLIIPGGGQFYNGENLKGLLLLSGAFYLAELDYRKGGMLPKIGLGSLYIASLTDAVCTLLHKKKS